MPYILYKSAREKARKKGPRWLYKYHGGDGKWRFCIGVSDKGVTTEAAKRAEVEAFRALKGYTDPEADRLVTERRRSIDQHRDDYKAALEAMHRASVHIRSTMAYIADVAKGCKWESLGDIRSDRAASYLAERSAARGTGARTYNATVKALRAFTRWCVTHSRLATDPLASLSTRNEATDRRHVRRDLTDVERDTLISTAELAPAVEWRRQGRRYMMTGTDRAMLYGVMLFSGLRLGEAASLTADSFQLDHASGPVIVLEAAYSKHRREDTQAIPMVLAAKLRPWLNAKAAAPAKPSKGAPAGQLWPLPYKAVDLMLKPDLKLAGIEYELAGAGVIDFHSLRHDYITGVAAVAPSFAAAQNAARHRSPAMTARYVHHNQADDQRLVNRAFPSASPASPAATEEPPKPHKDAQPLRAAANRQRRASPTAQPRRQNEAAKGITPYDLAIPELGEAEPVTVAERAGISVVHPTHFPAKNDRKAKGQRAAKAKSQNAADSATTGATMQGVFP